MTEAPKQVKIIIDSHELRSPIAKELEKLNINLQLETLQVGDYILSERVACERKTVDDFWKSLLGDRKLYRQLHDLKQYEIPILIIEGFEGELYTARNIDGRAVDGVLNSIALMGIPIRYTINPAGTAQVLASMASKEQIDNKKGISYHGKRSHLSTHEKMEYLITSIPDIGTSTAKSLLVHFGTIEEIAKAGISELMEVPNVGEKTACAIRNAMTENYNRSGK